jgi:phosphoglycerate dehydrogenase-like enzyme
MRIVFHGEIAGCFSDGFAALVGEGTEVTILPDALRTAAERRAFAGTEVIIGNRFDTSLPRPERLRLFHVPGAGYDAVDLVALPPGAVVCNCFGHEQAIAEYVMVALLLRQISLADADRRLRQGDWAYCPGAHAPARSPAGRSPPWRSFGAARTPWSSPSR